MSWYLAGGVKDAGEQLIMHRTLQRVVQLKVVMVLSWKNLDFRIQTGWFKPVFEFLK